MIRAFWILCACTLTAGAQIVYPPEPAPTPTPPAEALYFQSIGFTADTSETESLYSFDATEAIGAKLTYAGHGDFNGDGNLDLIYHGTIGKSLYAEVPYDTALAVRFGNGDGTFTGFYPIILVNAAIAGFSYSNAWTSETGTPDESNSPTICDIADFNNDGIDDLVLSLNSSSWQFTQNTDFIAIFHFAYADGIETSKATIATADVNRDGEVNAKDLLLFSQQWHKPRQEKEKAIQKTATKFAVPGMQHETLKKTTIVAP